jgi:DeoR/GlpR family transcriptional regulator of sugar metabolism
MIIEVGEAMYQEERLRGILSILMKEKRISIEEICETFQVSRDTARRDLVKLDELGEITRTRGGAILPSSPLAFHSYEERKNIRTVYKDQIGKAGARLIRNGEQVLLDSSTTVQAVIDNWQSTSNRVVTNSVDIAASLTGKHGIELHILGGKIHDEQRFIYGATAIEALQQLHFQKVLLGACGVTLQGLSNPYEEETTLLRLMIQRAEQVIVLADHTKFNHQLFHSVCTLEDIDILITDEQPDDILKGKLEQLDVQIIVTEGDGDL